MAHEVMELDRIYTYDGKASWHGVNTTIGSLPSSLEDAFERSGLGWVVSKEPLRFEEYRSDIVGDELEMGERSRLSFAITTKHEGKRIELGACGPAWTPLQNRSLFEQAHPFVENGFAIYETAGSIRNRRSVWVSLALGIDYVTDDDSIAKKILFSNNHDGLRGIKAGFCPERTECANTLSANLSTGRFLEIKHTRKVEENFKTISETMDVVNKKWLATMEIYRKLTKIVVNADKFDQYVSKCFLSQESLGKKFEAEEANLVEQGFSDEQIEEARRAFEKTLFPEIRKKVMLAYETAPGARLKGAYGTAWGAYNAITYILTHVRGESEESRLQSNLFGEGQRISARALQLAQKL